MTKAEQASPANIYAERVGHFTAQRDHYARNWNRLANARLLLFVAVALSFGLGWWLALPLLYALAALFTVGFIGVVVYHQQLGRLRQRYADLVEINAEGTLRLRRDWAALPLRQAPVPSPADPRAADLDLIGHASLQHLLGTAHTPIGQATVQEWLLNPATPALVLQRQAAVAELAAQIDYRDELALGGKQVAAQQSDYERFLAWTEGANWFAPNARLVWLTRLLTLLTLGGLLAQALGFTIYSFWLLCLPANIVLTLTLGRRAASVIEQVSARQETIRAYAGLFRLIAGQSFSAPLLRQFQQRLSAGGLRADQQMQRLGLIMAFADLRLNMYFVVIQLLTLWNFHILWLLERWQQVAGQQARSWLAALGEMEALAALAALAHDNPDWTFPTVSADVGPRLLAQRLGHPLLPPHVRVSNDVEIGPPGTFLLVTGSNMSGKSTLLRAIGMNVVLAQAGAPVCAAHLALPPLALGTSVRIQDSLEQGVSYFMAELQRLKMVVAAARAARGGASRQLFLLDEILHGTNTAERQIAARQIIRYLLDAGAIGAVSTHDLSLAEDPALLESSRPVHFTETFTRGPDGPAMHFDYRLRPGLATSTNALKLMELVGLMEASPH